ncbi:3-methyl-2-oxobutanoate hydroxymethyltransferase [Epidermidibacterium keratini]|uniref:3-methyl-2-oxobutanoate hydroxymethyltransferase n=1 Tax=Epidermidibacterium keratini TaxID=1891644 RepID=A0A7L4YPW7_9ACTN|nr:3-methyl-2-oxobutanoate hydroxymethyltransferase [Epidermidibacterium keratini]QHC01206.1 3-methyl-2-oxobutanoate hydroxymethyltransferase [Epidermidibacterium keratini]
MSTRPRPESDEKTRPKPVTLPGLLALKRERQPVAMITAYDFPTALAVDEAGVDIVLVGDSGAMTVLGYDSTVPVTVDEMLTLTKAARRGVRRALLVGDLPFGSYEASDELAVATATRFVKEAGCDAVKLEGGSGVPLARAKAIIAAGIPVMGHVGLTPQTATALGGFKAQGRTAEGARRIADEARALQAAGCFCIVLEAIPAELTEQLMPSLDASLVIGIGAGPATDGQVLVLHDMVGLGSGGTAKFVKRYAELHGPLVDAVQRYAGEVRDRAYPGPEHSYAMPEAERERLDLG